VDVGVWLKSLGLEEYAQAFKENAIDAGVVADLTAEDLKELGVSSVGHRRKILAAAARFTEHDHQTPTELPSSGRLPIATGERRHVAVLFADLAGFTRLTSELGAEQMHQILDAFFRQVDAIIEREGGRVDKHIGDCVMGVFGAPVSRGNDSERALKCAIAIRDCIEELSLELNCDVGVHIGVTTGFVVASLVGSGSTAEYAVTGESVNLASRLTEAAATGEILISDSLYQVLEERLVCEDAGALQVKGFTDPVKTWRVKELGQKKEDRGLFVGRKTELNQFISILRDRRDEGTGQVVVLRGAAGIGKTRLSEQFETLAKDLGFACCRGLVLDFGAESERDPIRSILRELIGLSVDSDEPQLRQCVANLISTAVVARDLEASLNDLLNLSQPDRLLSIINAMHIEERIRSRGAVLAQIVKWASKKHPLLLIVEDVHWANPAQLEMLAQLATAIQELPAVLLMTSRIEGDPIDRGWRASIGGTYLSTMDMAPLRDVEARQICDIVLGDSSHVEVLISRSGGNPLFLEHLLRHSSNADDQAVPGTIQSLVQAALDRLSAIDKKAIQAASVLGQRVNIELVHHLVEDATITPDRLVERNLLRPQGEDYLFAHALVRDAVYASLLSTTRQALHNKAAKWYSRRDLSLHAEHLALAGAPEAAGAFIAAADEKLKKYHYQTALALIRRGVEVPGADNEKGKLLLMQGDAYLDLGQMANARQAYETALATISNPLDRCLALVGLAGIMRVTDDLDGALAQLEAAQTIAQQHDLVSELSRVHFLRGNILFPRGELDACLFEHQESLRLARRAGRPDLEAMALGGLGDAEYVRGRMASARTRLSECVDLSAEQHLGRTEVANLAQVAHTLIYTSSQEAALEAAQNAIDLAHRVGHKRAEVNARAAATAALFTLARYRECLEECARLRDNIEQLGATRFLQHVVVFEGRALHALGRTEQSKAIFEDGLRFAKDTGFAFHGPGIASAFALLVQDRDQKIGLLRMAEQTIASGCVGHNQFWVYASGLDIAFGLEDQTMLSAYIKLLQEFPEGEPVSWCTFHALRGRALLKHLEGSNGSEQAELLGQAEVLGTELAMNHWLGSEPFAGN